MSFARFGEVVSSAVFDEGSVTLGVFRELSVVLALLERFLTHRRHPMCGCKNQTTQYQVV